jgi:hypothetical protein
MALFHSDWNKRVAQELTVAGQALGLAPADYHKQVAAAWQMQPLAGRFAALPAFHSGCVAGSWQGRLVSASMMLPHGGTPRASDLNLSKGVDWSEGNVLVTSVGFIGQVIPYMAAAPTSPLTINSHRTYKWSDWFPGLGVHEFGTRIPVPGDTGNAWMVRAIQTARPAAILKAVAPLLLGEPPFIWRVDGGKDRKPVVDLVRVDVAMPDAPTPDAQVLQDRFARLTALATAIENAIAHLPADLPH